MIWQIDKTGLTFLAAAGLLVLVAIVLGQGNPAGRLVGPDGKPLSQAVVVVSDPTPAPLPAPVGTESWTTLIAALVAAIVTVLGAIQSLRNSMAIAAVYKTVKGQDDPPEKVLPLTLGPVERGVAYRPELPPATEGK